MIANGGMSLAELHAKVQDLQASKLDLVVDSRRLTMKIGGSPEGDRPTTLWVETQDGPLGLDFNDVWLTQALQRTKIPLKHGRRLLADHADLLASELNALWSREPAQGMLRTMGGKARAWLSTSFRRLDHLDMLEATLPTLEELGARALRGYLSDSRLYLNVINPNLSADLSPKQDGSDMVYPGLCLSNSEVGMGSTRVEGFLFNSFCENGMIFGKKSAVEIRQTHLGKRTEVHEAFATVATTSRTQRLQDELFWSQVQDAVTALFQEEQFTKWTGTLRSARQREIGAGADVAEVTKLVATRFNLTEAEEKAVLSHVTRDAHQNGATQYGWAQGITRTAQDSFVSPDRAVELHRIGGEFVGLSERAWNVYANAGLN